MLYGNDSVYNPCMRRQTVPYHSKTQPKQQRRQRRTCLIIITCGTRTDIEDGGPDLVILTGRVTTPVQHDTTDEPTHTLVTIHTPDNHITITIHTRIPTRTDMDTDKTPITTANTPTWPSPPHSNTHENAKPHTEVKPPLLG
jgi:hypothetical protein